MGPDSAFYVVVASAAGAVLLAWAYFRAYERIPLTEDELSLIRWNERHFGDTLRPDNEARTSG